MQDWDDLRHFLAVADTGSTLAAGRALGVSQTTAARRVAALEAALGLTLFDRRQAGYALTADGEALVGRARAVADAVEAVADAAAARTRSVSGTVRLTAPETYAISILSPILRDLHDAHPGIMIELDTSAALRDLAGGAADIALRVMARPGGAGIVGRRLGDDRWALYCSRGYAAQHGWPRRRADVVGHPIIGGGEPGVWEEYRSYLVRAGLEGSIAMHHNTTLGLIAAVRSGIGLAALPCYVADTDPDLLRCLPSDTTERGVWLLTHERVRREPRVRTVIDFIAERFPRLAGHDEAPSA